MKIVVLAGGISPERDVSLSSGSLIYRELKERGHQVVLLDVFLGYAGEEENIFERDYDWAAEIGNVSEESPDIEQIKALRPDWKKNFFGPKVIAICQAADVVFMGLHGENGENGRIQAYFDLMGIRYTGTDYVSSAICMDKGLAKELFAVHGIPTPQGFRLKKEELETYLEERKPNGEAVVSGDGRELSLPLVVKACNGGSSVGVYMVNKEEEYEKALREAFGYDDEVIIEQYIKGREFSVGVMEGRALPVIEIAPKQGFYDYKNKYQAGSTIETCPADISEEKTREMQRWAEKAFQILRLKNYARMDFMMNEAGEMFCLEANTLPGMTPTSLLPQEAAAEGVSFGELCEKIIESALRAAE